LEKQKKEGKAYAAICAAPAVVLASKGLIEGEGATCYPAPVFRYVVLFSHALSTLIVCQCLIISIYFSREQMSNPSDEDVVITAGKLTTSKGPGTALKFALELGEQLFGKEARDKIQAEMLV
jgi:4-methyl-5(b-hydroxyethyl)-thiazole monophosphate biosynthesis